MPPPDKKFIQQAFDSITPRYDLLNEILSFGQADRWRKKACEIVLQNPHPRPLPLRQTASDGSVLRRKGEGALRIPLLGGEGRVRGMASILDLGCGTGKFLECFLRAKSWESATGVDFSVTMLQKARATVPIPINFRKAEIGAAPISDPLKLKGIGTVSGSVLWLQQDFEALPFLESSFDLVVSAFTLRSVQKLPEFLQTVHRILTPGGRAAFLDLTRPRNFWALLFFFPYLKVILPLLGWLLSGNRKAYGFLSGSVRKFQSPEETIRLMQAAGYRDLTSKSFAFGAATLIIGEK